MRQWAQIPVRSDDELAPASVLSDPLSARVAVAPTREPVPPLEREIALLLDVLAPWDTGRGYPDGLIRTNHALRD